jgi:hypothetical protein
MGRRNAQIDPLTIVDSDGGLLPIAAARKRYSHLSCPARSGSGATIPELVWIYIK